MYINYYFIRFYFFLTKTKVLQLSAPYQLTLTLHVIFHGSEMKKTPFFLTNEIREELVFCSHFEASGFVTLHQMSSGSALLPLHN